MSWFTDRKVGETAVLPGGVRIRIVAIRGCKVRLEFLNPPPPEPPRPPEVRKPLVVEGDAPHGEGRAER